MAISAEACGSLFLPLHLNSYNLLLHLHLFLSPPSLPHPLTSSSSSPPLPYLHIFLLLVLIHHLLLLLRLLLLLFILFPLHFFHLFVLFSFFYFSIHFPSLSYSFFVFPSPFSTSLSTLSSSLSLLMFLLALIFFFSFLSFSSFLHIFFFLNNYFFSFPSSPKYYSNNTNLSTRLQCQQMQFHCWIPPEVLFSIAQYPQLSELLRLLCMTRHSFINAIPVSYGHAPP